MLLNGQDKGKVTMENKEIIIDAWCVSVTERDTVGCPFQGSNTCQARYNKACWVSRGQSFPDDCPLKEGSITVKIKEN